jgi:hypothetical protein
MYIIDHPLANWICRLWTCLLCAIFCRNSQKKERPNLQLDLPRNLDITYFKKSTTVGNCLLAPSMLPYYLQWW